MAYDDWQEAWVTIALDENSAVKAMILAQSLRNVMTNRKLVVLAGPSLSLEIRNCLEMEFDGYFQIPNDQQKMERMNRQNYAKPYCWTLTFIKKCVFIDPDTIVLRNCDELFSNYEIAATGVYETNVNKARVISPSIFVFKPSLSKYHDLLLKLDTNASANECGFGNWLTQHQDFEYLNEKYVTFVDFENNKSKSYGYTSEAMIVHFVGAHPLQLLTDFGLKYSSKNVNTFEKRILEYYKEMYTKVKLSLSNCEIHNGINGIREVRKKHCSEPIAIVGMACRLPGANDVEEFWKLLMNNGDGITRLPEGRWSAEQSCIVDSEAKNIQAGFLKCPVDEFDSKFFGISPMELVYTDPQQRLLLEILWEALEDAAIDPLSLENTKTGIFTGTWTNDYRELMTESGFREREFYRSYMGNSFGATAGRLAHFLGTIGTNIATESGCSSSMVAVGLACQSLRRRESSMTFACGVNLLLHPFRFSDMQSVISPDGHCKTFDAKADGFGRAEGCCVLVLKRLSDAVRNDDRIHAVIRGYGATQEGSSKSMGTPTVQCEALAMKLALDDAGIEPHEVSFVEAHGTGTAVGDPMEIEAIENVYSKDRTVPLYISSVKANIGHTESCSGITGIIKTVLSLRNEIIPPHRSLETLNPRINLEKIPAVIPLENITWEKKKELRRMGGVSSFGITGTDAHVIIEESPTLPDISCPRLKPSQYILTLSAKSEEAFDKLLVIYLKYLQQNSLNMVDVAFTASTGRAHFQAYRAAVIGSDCMEVASKIEKNAIIRQQCLSETPKICFLFTGQGSQYHGMGKTLYETCPVFRMHFDTCDEILQKSYGISIKKPLWSLKPSDELNRTLYSQTSIFCMEYCISKVWESWEIKPDLVVGHSLGEFAAAAITGILTLHDALKLVAERSKLIDSLPMGKMVVIKATRKTAECLLKEFNAETRWLDFAAINSPEQTVLAGAPAAINSFVTICENNNIKTHILNATHAFHSRDMEPILPEYGKVASSIKYSKPCCDYISGMDGTLLEEKMNAKYWVRHTMESVNFLEASKEVLERGATIFIEVGPQPVLSALLTRNIEELGVSDTTVFLPSLRKKEDEWVTLLGSLAKLYTLGFKINWKEFYRYYNKKKISLPFYPFQRKKYWFESKLSRKSTMTYCGKELHPLIGYCIPNATSLKIFENAISLQKFPYLKDHAIGKHLIFPGAGYLEMCLVAGYASNLLSMEDFDSPAGPLILEAMSIKAPLAIGEEGFEAQTVVSNMNSSEEPGWTKIGVYRQRGECSAANKWMEHASARFRSALSSQESKEELNFSEIETKFVEDFTTEQFYQRLSEVGLNFGKNFQSIAKVWKNGQEILAEVSIPEECCLKDYLCHPVLIDSMIQSLMLGDESIETSLCVPVFVQKFIWLANSDSRKYYTYISKDLKNGSESIERTASLYDENGKKLAIMIGVQVVKTTLESITKAIEAQKLHLPSILEEEWRPQSSKLPIQLEGQFLTVSEQQEMVQLIETTNFYTEEEYTVKEVQHTVFRMFVMKSFRELGCDPKIGEILQLDNFIREKAISENHISLVTWLFEILCQDGFIEKTSKPVGYKVLKDFPSIQQAQDVINEKTNYILAEFSDYHIELELMVTCLEKLTLVLLGKGTVLPILFPEGESNLSAEIFYQKSKIGTHCNNLLSRTIDYVLGKRIKPLSQDGEVKILEIGAGTGSATKNFLQLLEKHGIFYNYTYTDISTVFFIKAETTFSKYSKNLKYKILNIEEDPKLQGFSPYEYDIVLASNVLHATRNLQESVNNARHMLKSSGILIILETFIPQRVMDGVFGLVDGFWRFTDHELRPYHPLIDHNKWKTLLLDSGFQSCSSLKGYENSVGVLLAEASSEQAQYKSSSTTKKIWMIFTPEVNYDFSNKLACLMQSSDIMVGYLRDSKNTSGINCNLDIWVRPNVIEDFGSAFDTVKREFPNAEIDGVLYLWGIQNVLDQKVIAGSYLNLIQTLITKKLQTNLKLVVVTAGISNIGDHPVSPALGTLLGMTKSFQSEHSSAKCRIIDIDPDDLTCQSCKPAEEVFSEIWKDDHELQIAFRQGVRHIGRVVNAKFPQNSLSLPNSKRFCLNLPSSKSITDLRFGILPKQQISGKEIEIQVKATALNFKDVLNVIKPDSQFSTSNSVGADFAGIITVIGPGVKGRKVGDAVIGCNFENWALPSFIRSFEDAVVPLPDDMTYAEGCTLPAVFSTAYYCLVEIGKLKCGETILIHTASGGVGLVAIQIAKHIGARIIATAGNKRKRNYLHSLGIEHVFNSRDLSFGQGIKIATKGEGVHIVLNSLTSPGFKETSLTSCCTNARFIEMSKLNIWKPEEVENRRPDVQYSIVDLTTLSYEKWKYLHSQLDKCLKANKIKPIPYTPFDAVNIREALTYLQKAKHIGKVVCLMPEIRLKNEDYLMEVKENLFNDRSTYLITGGLRGLGLETAKWMTEHGAKHLALCGRSQPDDKAEKVIKHLNETGNHVIAFKTDVGKYEECQRLLQDIRKPQLGFPCLRGVIHSAGTLSDGLIEKQSWEKYEYTFNSKVQGVMNLHELTKSTRLEYFVLYSSVASIFGGMGQSNHAAGNAFMDTFAHYRNSLGLCATSINWGQWGQVGVAADIDVPGIIPMTPLQAFSALELVLKSQKTQAAIIEWDVPVVKLMYPWTKHYLAEIHGGSSKVQTEIKKDDIISSKKFWEDIDQVADAEVNEKYEKVLKYTVQVLSYILKLDPTEKIDYHQNFQDIGLDSLMMVELKNVLQGLLGNRVTLNISTLSDCNTVHLLTTKLVDLIYGNNTLVPMTQEEYKNLIIEDSKLSAHVKGNGNCVNLTDIKTVLLTGATGNLAAYILESLSQNSQINKIYCLVRVRNSSNSKERLVKNLNQKGILKNTDMTKVEVISTNNLSEPRLGLEDALYQTLCTEVDAVIHCAVKSHHLEEYKKSEGTTDIRSVNVIGTQRILEFASESKTKWVYHASTMAAVLKVNGDDKICPETWPKEDDFDQVLSVGYATSKFIADRLMAQAVENGIPCKVFRFPYIAGDSRSGHLSTQDNHIFLRFLSYLKTGLMPSLPLPMLLLPVNLCANISLQVFFNPDAPPGIYNVTNPINRFEQDFTQIAEDFGYHVKIVEFSEFVQKIIQDGEKSILFPLKDLYINPQGLSSITATYNILDKWLENPNEFFASIKLLKIIPNYSKLTEDPLITLRRDLQYAKDSGIFEKFGL